MLTNSGGETYHKNFLSYLDKFLHNFKKDLTNHVNAYEVDWQLNPQTKMFVVLLVD